MLDFLLTIDKNDPLPRHLQVQQALQKLLTSGRLRPGDKIASEVEIADALGVSRMTVNKAILSLTSEGLFIREVGRGTFVAPLVTPGAVSTDEPIRITLSFVAGAKDVLESDYYSTLYRGVLDAVSEEGDGTVNVILSPLAAVDYVAEEERAPTDGRLIVSPRRDSIPSIQRLWDRGKSIVVLGASWPEMTLPSIDSDNVGGAIEAIRYLAERGHRQIALLYAEEESANTQDRIRGYRRGIAQAGLSVPTGGEIRARAVWSAGEGALRDLAATLTRKSEPVTAIFAAGFYLALEAMNAVRMAGLRAPDQVSVIGYDDPLTAQLVYPPLTTVRQPLREMGRRATERLLRQVRAERRSPDHARTGRVVHELLPSQLIVRESAIEAPKHATQNMLSSCSLASSGGQ